MSFKRILVPVDFSPCSRRALDVAVDLARELGAKIDLLHAWTAPAYVSPYVAVQVSSEGPAKTLEDLAKEEAKKEMDRFLEGLTPPGAEPLGIRIEFGFEPDVILAAAKSYDLVVMGTHGRAGLAHLILGSVTERVLRRSTTPVLTVHDSSPPAKH